MSCSMKSDLHIASVVMSALYLDINFSYFRPSIGARVYAKNERSGQGTAEMLKYANIVSICANRGEEMPDASEVEIRMEHRILKPVEMLAALRSMDYQTCEMPNYRESDAFYCMEAIRDTAIKNLEGFRGCESEMWSIE